MAQPFRRKIARACRIVVLVHAALVLGGVTPPLAAAQEPVTDRDVTISELGRQAEGVPVVYRARELYRLKSGIGSLSAADRARAVAGRIDDLVRDDAVAPDDIVSRDLDHHSEVVAGGRVLAIITDADARANGDKRQLVAEAVAVALRRIVADTRAEFSPDSVRRSVVQALVVTVLVAIALAVARRAATFGRRVITERAERHIEGLRIQHAEIVSAERVREFLLNTIRWMWVATCVVVAVTWVHLVLAALPWTRPIADRVLEWAWAPLATIGDRLVAFLPNLFYLAAIALLTWAGARMLRFVADQVASGRIAVPDFDPEWADPTYRIGRVLLVALALVAAFPYLPGSQSPAFQGVSLLLGLIVSLSSSSAISNAISGIILTYTSAFRTGEKVRIGETTGTVVKKTLFVTQLRTIKNEIVAVPNSSVLGSSVQNYSRMAEREGVILYTSVTIGYDAPWRQVHALLADAARRTEGLLTDPAPFVLQTSLSDFFVSYELNCYTRRPNETPHILSRLHGHIQDAFNEAGVEIMSPHMLGLRDANTVTIPSAHRPAEYEAPAFRVQSPAGSPPRASHPV